MYLSKMLLLSIYFLRMVCWAKRTKLQYFLQCQRTVGLQTKYKIYFTLYPRKRSETLEVLLRDDLLKAELRGTFHCINCQFFPELKVAIVFVSLTVSSPLKSMTSPSIKFCRKVVKNFKWNPLLRINCLKLRLTHTHSFGSFKLKLECTKLVAGPKFCFISVSLGGISARRVAQRLILLCLIS